MNNELKTFIIDFCKEQKIKNIDLSVLNSEAFVDLDLDIVDIDIDLFMTDFFKRFCIDYSEFDWNNYGGYPYGGSFFYLIIRTFFSYKKMWVKKLCRKLYTPTFKISYLEKAILNKKM
jgi:hypothetical protein